MALPWARTPPSEKTPKTRRSAWAIRFAPDGIEGFKAFLGFLREKFPQSRSEIKRVWAEGDYVIVHVHAVRTPGTRGSAIVDVFKLENGKIVEHWDVIQEIPEKAANNNGMF